MRKVISIPIFILLFFNVLAQSKTEQVNLLILNQKYSEALKLSNELVDNYPDSAYYYYQNSIVNKLMYRYPQALNSVQKALAIDAENVDYLNEYGVLLDKKDQEQKAAEVFKQVFDRDSSHYYSGVWLSNNYLSKKQYDRALHILNALYHTDTINSFLARNIGLCWYKKGSYKNSKRWFIKTLQLDSTDIKAYKYLFSVYAGNEEFELAFNTIDKAIRIDPKNKYLYIMKGDLQVIRNHHYQAVKTYHKAFSIDPNDEDIARKLGISYYEIKKYDKAKHYLLFADKHSINLDVYKYLGFIYKIQNIPDSSTTYFNKALELLHPDNNTIFQIYVNIAENYLSQKYYEHTVNWYEQALKLNLDGIWAKSDKNRVLIDLASVYSDKIENKQKAIDCLQKVSNDSQLIFNKEDYYSYAQKEIERLKEELFFEGKL